jgi:hypothetical protein
MKANGLMILDAVGLSNATQITTLTSATSRMERLMARAYTSGATARSMTANGSAASSMVTVCGLAPTAVIHTLENGGTQRPKATGYTSGKMATDMKVSGSNASSMEMEQTFLLTATHIKANFVKGKHMERDSTRGLMVQYMWANFLMALSMVRADGSQLEMSPM